MVVVTNRRGDIILMVESGEEPDTTDFAEELKEAAYKLSARHQRELEEAARSLKQAHDKLKGFKGTHGLEDLEKELAELVVEEENELATIPSHVLADEASIPWRTSNRVERYKKLEAVVKKMQASVAHLHTLVDGLDRTGYLGEGHGLFLGALRKVLHDLMIHLHFFAQFFLVYHKTSTKEEVHQYLRKLEDHHGKPRGQLSLPWLKDQFNATLTKFKQVVSNTDELITAIKVLIDIDEEIMKMPGQLVKVEVELVDMEVKVELLHKWIEELQAKQAAGNVSEVYLLNSKVKQAKITVEDFKLIPPKLKLQLEGILQILKKPEALNIIKGKARHIKDWAEDLLSRVEAIIALG